KATLWNDRVTFYTYGMRPINDIGTTTTYQSLGAFWTYKDDYYSDDRNDQWNKYNNSYERTQNALTFSDPQSGVVQGNAYMTFTNDSGDQTFHAKSSYAVIPSGFDRSTHYWTWNNHFQPA
ncbi:MAG: hypothetical protein LBD05_00005, partial [Mycoplasmataceae bacterium]|nr:hypothetical protein [Mycoplasmataceae bacterium]